jgi:hypothetical protein
MNPQEQQAFAKANETIHPVEKQWHYPILSGAGYEALTKEGVGFVRTYEYFNEATGSRIYCTTGSNADYWKDTVHPNGGYWSALAPHVAKLAVDLLPQ